MLAKIALMIPAVITLAYSELIAAVASAVRFGAALALAEYPEDVSAVTRCTL